MNPQEVEAELKVRAYALSVGQEHTITLEGIVSFTAVLSWEDEMDVTVKVKDIHYFPNFLKFHGTTRGLHDDVRDYVYNHQVHLIDAFKEKILAFDKDATKWGADVLGDPLGFYAKHIW